MASYFEERADDSQDDFEAAAKRRNLHISEDSEGTDTRIKEIVSPKRDLKTQISSAMLLRRKRELQEEHLMKARDRDEQGQGQGKGSSVLLTSEDKTHQSDSLKSDSSGGDGDSSEFTGEGADHVNDPALDKAGRDLMGYL